MSSEPAPDVRSLRARVLAAASSLPSAARLLARAHVVVVTVPTTCVLSPMLPLMFREADDHNGVLATFLATLPGYFTGITRNLMPAALASLAPPSMTAADPPSLLALMVVSRVREAQPAAPFDTYLSFNELVPELLRMRLPAGEARFVPLFDRDWKRVFPILPRLFRNVVSPVEVRRHLHTVQLHAPHYR
ncbi:hypothetical protein AB1Y20_008237 [Prymnesium parvum]|uniref:Uncharacterized protein n=1 Tax=Prymnesium parvum TaxID=97485 RepID=A0AB34IXE4_PRYPA